MGSRQQNFYNQLAQRLGARGAGRRHPGQVPGGGQTGRRGSSRPHDLIDSTCLLRPGGRGSPDRMRAYAEAGATTLTLSPAGFTLEER